MAPEVYLFCPFIEHAFHYVEEATQSTSEQGGLEDMSFI